MRLPRSLRCAAMVALAIAALAGGCDNTPEFGYQYDAAPQPDGATPPAPDAAPTSGECGIDSPFGAGRTVVFGGPDGAILGTSLTDADGSARFDACVSGTMATVVIPNDPSSAMLATAAGLSPGVVVRVFFPPPEPDTTNVDVDVTVDSNISDLDSPSWYELHLSGFNYPSTSPPSITAPGVPLHDDGTFDAVAVARQDGPDGPVVGYIAQTGITPSGNPTPLALGPWVPVTTVPELSVDVTNAPAQAAAVTILVQSLRGSLEILQNSADLDLADIADGGATATVQLFPVDIADRLRLLAQVPYVDGGFAMSWMIRGTATTATIDLATTLPPHLAGDIVSFPQDDPQRALVTWFADGSLDGRDGVELFLTYDSSTWFIVTPDASAGSFRLPELPPAFASYVPTLSDSVQIPYLSVFDYDWIDYQDVIATSWLPATLGLIPDFYAPPIDSTMSVSLLVP